jgi:multidrug efflux pump subunit AcrA (membrane-fusion protein)
MNLKKTLRKIPLPVVLAVLGLWLAASYMITASKPQEKPKPVRPPAASPYLDKIAGVGIVESQEENIEIAPYWSGKVVQVYVREGDDVAAGAPLFRLDTQALESQLQSRRAEVTRQRAALIRMKNEPRPEDLAPLRAQIEEAKANLSDQQAQLQRFESVSDPRAITQDELTRKRFAVAAAQAQLARAQADYKRVSAGAWIYDIRQAEANLKAAETAIRELQVQIAQGTVRAPVASRVLQVNLRPGEFIGTQPPEAPVILGQIGRLQVRVDIDEINASQIRPNMPATAFLKGDSRQGFPLRFVRVEPYMVPKRNLTGATSERVDVRVLQLIYDFAPPPFPVYVGQQVDVFLKNKA